MPRSARFGELVPSAEERPHGGRSRARPVAPIHSPVAPPRYRAPRSRGGTSGWSFRGTLRWGVGRGSGARPSGVPAPGSRGETGLPRVAVCGGTAARGVPVPSPFPGRGGARGGNPGARSVRWEGETRWEKACGRATESRRERERESGKEERAARARDGGRRPGRERGSFVRAPRIGTPNPFCLLRPPPLPVVPTPALSAPLSPAHDAPRTRSRRRPAPPLRARLAPGRPPRRSGALLPWAVLPQAGRIGPPPGPKLSRGVARGGGGRPPPPAPPPSDCDLRSDVATR